MSLTELLPAIHALPRADKLRLNWAKQTTPIHLTGNLAQAEARAVVLSAMIASLPTVRLAFAWTQLTTVPVILGQVNLSLNMMYAFSVRNQPSRYGRSRIR